MTIDEMITLLEIEKAKRGGGVEVQLHGMYGSSETTFEVLEDCNVRKGERNKLNIWTGINTG